MSDRPRIRVAALMVYRGRVVVVRHRKGDATYHLLPGGGVRLGETLADALVREVAEETGIACRVGRPIILGDTIAPDGSRHVVNITFACDVMGGEIRSVPDDPRVECVELVAVEELVDLDLRPPIATHLVEATRSLDTFVTTYTGSIYAPEQADE